MNKAHKSQGWTLVELMLVVALIGILASIAIPSYNSYISTSETSVSSFNLRQLATFEENYFYEAGDYLYARYDPGAGTNPFTPIGWSPEGDNNAYVYDVSASASCAKTYCATITIYHVDDTATPLQTLDLSRN